MNDLNTTGGAFQVIYADPPWSYSNGKKKSAKLKGGAERHYSTMTLADIKALPVESIAARDAFLFMWVPFPFLQEGLDTIKAWGFTYKTLGFSWHKNYPNGRPFFGVGWYTRSNAEICLLAIRGRPRKVSSAVSSAVLGPLGRHSSKPDEIRERIVKFAGDVPRIELFARRRADGWQSWGDQVDDAALLEGL